MSVRSIFAEAAAALTRMVRAVADLEAAAVPKAIGASCGTNDATVSRWAAETSGPISVTSLWGLPTTTPLTAGSRSSMKRS